MPRSGRGRRSRRIEESQSIPGVEYWPIIWVLLLGLALFAPRGPLPGMAALGAAVGAVLLATSRKLGAVRFAAAILFAAVFAVAMWKLRTG